MNTPEGWSAPRPLKHRYDCLLCGRRITPDQVAMTHTSGGIAHATCVTALVDLADREQES